FRWLKRNVRENVILYFEAFADMLEEKLLKTVTIDMTAMISTSLTGKERVQSEAEVLQAEC
ncbi:MAG: hypothetical protein JNJ86_02360, partial [Chitinophagaceae bacterium]|nr:hypothetical protein [Chitinophagaceae bacterium]